MVSETPPFVRGTNACFTLFNPNGLDLRSLFASTNIVKAAAWQHEDAPSTGTPHYQGLVAFHKATRANIANASCFDNRASLTRCDHPDKALQYCTREFNEDSTRKRSPLTSELTDAGPWFYPDEQTVRDHFVARGSNQRKKLEFPTTRQQLFDKIHNGEIEPQHYPAHSRFLWDKLMDSPGRTHQTRVLVLYGGTGLFKTTFVKFFFPGAYPIAREEGSSSGAGKVWFNGYDPTNPRHQIVKIDDFHSTLRWELFKELINNSEFFVPTKGGKVPFMARLFIIISNDNPDTWYNNIKNFSDENRKAVERRLSPPICMRVHVLTPFGKIVSTPRGEDDIVHFFPTAFDTFNRIKDWYHSSSSNLRIDPQQFLPSLLEPSSVSSTAPTEPSTPSLSAFTQQTTPPREEVQTPVYVPTVHSPECPDSTCAEPPSPKRIRLTLRDSNFPVINASWNPERNRLEYSSQ